jgi:hypothetical protein
VIGEFGFVGLNDDQFCFVGLAGHLVASLPSCQGPAAGRAGIFHGVVPSNVLSIRSSKTNGSFRRGFAARSMFSPLGLFDGAVRLGGFQAQVH